MLLNRHPTIIMKLLFSLLFAFVACSALGRQPHSITITDCALTIDGTPMISATQDLLVEKTQAVVGPPERTEYMHHGGAVHFWDSAELRAIPDDKNATYWSLDISLSGQLRVTNSPQAVYHGELLFDGFTVTPATNISDLNTFLKKRAFKLTGPGKYSLYSMKCSKGGVQILCDEHGAIITISIWPKGLPKH
jgi:hypothetical protein